MRSPLIDTELHGARGILLSIAGGDDLTLLEVNEAAEVIKQTATDETQIIFGATIDDAAGEAFVLGSPQQLGRILFEKLELTPGRKGKTGYSTDSRVLRTRFPLPGATPLHPATNDYRPLFGVLFDMIGDSQLNILAEGPELAIAHSLSKLESMDDWNRIQHTKSGLWHRVLADGVGMADAEARTLSFMAEWVPPHMSPMCGNSICQDRRFLHRLMPRVEKHFHYRSVDVSTLKELARRWAPQVLAGMRKDSAHTALSDVRDSINELRHYRRNLAAFASE